MMKRGFNSFIELILKTNCQAELVEAYFQEMFKITLREPQGDKRFLIFETVP
jgi:hypothetical protein